MPTGVYTRTKKVSDITKEKLRQCNLGKKHSPEALAKMRLVKLGKVLSEETKGKISLANKGRASWCKGMYGESAPFYGKKHTDSAKEKISKAFNGKKISEEHRLKISEALKKRIVSEETKNKISLAKKGKTHSEKSKKHFSEGQQRRVREGNNILWKHGLSYTSDYQKAIKHNRRLKEKTGGHLTTEIIKKIYDFNIKQYGKLSCYLCNAPILCGKEHLEHKIPISRGGNNDFKNLGIACAFCNKQKRNKTEVEYRDWLNNRNSEGSA